MRGEVADWIAAALYTAAGRQAEEPEFLIWRTGLSSAPEEGFEEVVEAMIASVDWGVRGVPTPALYLDFHRAQAKRERGVHKCECGGSKLVQVEGEVDAYVPCGRCNPVGRDRWTKGKYAPKFLGISDGQREREAVAALRLQLPDPEFGP